MRVNVSKDHASGGPAGPLTFQNSNPGFNNRLSRHIVGTGVSVGVGVLVGVCVAVGVNVGVLVGVGVNVGVLVGVAVAVGV